MLNLSLPTNHTDANVARETIHAATVNDIADAVNDIGALIDGVNLGRLAQATLNADAASLTLDLSAVDLSNVTVARLIGKFRGNGTAAVQNYAHIFMTLNGDTAAGNYGWSVQNSDATNAIATAGSEAHILVGHYPESDAVSTTAWGTIELAFPFPGDTAMAQNVNIRNAILTDFASYADLNPIEMTGAGFWSGTAALTSITFTAETDSFLAGSKVVLLAP